MAKLMLVDHQVWWRARRRGTVVMSARPVGGKPRPDGHSVVSLRHEGRMCTYRIERIRYMLEHNGAVPKGRVEVVDGVTVDLPRRARSPGRRGGLKAERARDVAMLAALKDGPLTVAGAADATGVERTNARKRLDKLAAQGLVERPPRCCPARGWLLCSKGRGLVDGAALDETDLLEPADLNGHAVPWVRDINDYVRTATTPSASARFG